ncbi:potassium channel family protein [Streptomyces sp. P6-2-1]|uniref:potassium channel family protein n=1 Tax=unclassified Streptomyces TaxID=2593676 RepID=UPI003D36904A
MVVAGDDALAPRIAAELAEVYRERVTLIEPPAPEGLATGGAFPGRGLGRASAFFDRFGFVRGRAADSDREPAPHGGVEVVEAARLDDAALTAAGIATATALALVHEEDEVNIHAALRARRLNPRLRLVIRLYNRRLGQQLEHLLDQAAVVAGLDEGVASVTVLSDAATAAPALAASAVAGTSKVIEADGILLRAVERRPPGRGEVAAPGLATLALLSATVGDPGGAEGSDSSADAPRLLPDDAEVAAAAGRETVVLEQIGRPGAPAAAGRFTGWRVPLGSLFSARLRWSVAGLGLAVLVLTAATMVVTGEHPQHAAYVTLLDLFAINDPIDDGKARQILQLLNGLVGLLILPVLVAATLEAFGTFRSASTLRRPPRGLAGHVVLLGLGKIGTRVLARLHEMNVPVVCVEEDPEARGIPLARRLRVPCVIGDVTDEGVLEAAKIGRASALLAVTSVDATNLEAALYARSLHPRLRVSLRLFDDDFATAVYRTLRAAHPAALTRSRSVSSLAAPAFAGAMMGRQVLGAIPVERRVLLFAALDVAGRPELEGRTVAEAFRPGSWRVIALDTSGPAERAPDLGSPGGQGGAGLVWDLHPGYVLRPEDRVVLAATRHGLGSLLGRRREDGTRTSGR